jgi:hypothetical protein
MVPLSMHGQWGQNYTTFFEHDFTRSAHSECMSSGKETMCMDFVVFDPFAMMENIIIDF